MDKSIYWSIRLTLGVLGIFALYSIVPYFMNLLRILIELFKLTDTTPEFKIILICISIYVTCQVINTIVNLIFKLHSLVEDKWIIKTK